MAYTPQFLKTKRNGKIALWIVLPNKTKQNIGDVNKLSKDMEEIIIFAFNLGMRAGLDLVKQIKPPSLYSSETFEEVTDE